MLNVTMETEMRLSIDIVLLKLEYLVIAQIGGLVTNDRDQIVKSAYDHPQVG
jgi:hypothetical protein